MCPFTMNPQNGILLGHRILRDFSSDYNLPPPVYFVGVITEFKPPHSSSSLKTLLPEKRINTAHAILDDGLYRVRYLDTGTKYKDKVSPAEAYEG